MSASESVKSPPWLKRGLRRAHGWAAMRIGRISSLKPLSTEYSYDRGTPIDRFYIDQFLSKHVSDVCGRVLEVGEDSYSRSLGNGRISTQDVLHVDPTNEAATIVGDLVDPETLPPATFDCIIMTQTLPLIFNVASAIANIRRSLRPGGVALLTVCGINPIAADEWQDTFYWMFTPRALERLLKAEFDPDKIEVESFGNLYAATAHLHGAAVQEVSKSKLMVPSIGNEYSVLIAARAVA